MKLKLLPAAHELSHEEEPFEVTLIRTTRVLTHDRLRLPGAEVGLVDGNGPPGSVGGVGGGPLVGDLPSVNSPQATNPAGGGAAKKKRVSDDLAEDALASLLHPSFRSCVRHEPQSTLGFRVSGLGFRV